MKGLWITWRALDPTINPTVLREYGDQGKDFSGTAMTSAEPLQPSASGDSLSGQVHAIFDSSEHGMFGVDAPGHIGYRNQRREQLFNLPQSISIKSKPHVLA
jgi:PAS domain-containing protein